MASTELSHVGHVFLRQVHGLTFLENTLTGECCRVPPDAQVRLVNDKAAVRFKEDGKDVAKWANEIFIMSVHQHGDKSVIFNRVSKVVCPLPGPTDFEAGVFAQSLSGERVECQVYLHGQAKKPGNRIWWILPYVQDMVFGETKHNRWICANIRAWRRSAKLAGLPEDIFRASQKSILGNHRVKRSPVAASVVVNGETEFSCSTKGLVFLLCKWFAETAHTERIKVVMATVCDVFLGQESFKITVDRIALTFQNGKLVQETTMDATRARLYKEVIGKYTSLSEVILEMGAVLLNQFPSRRTPTSLAVFNALLEVLDAAVEMTSARDMWRSKTALSLPVLKVSPGSKRPRRLAVGFKQAVGAVVSSSPHFRKGEQLLEGMRTLSAALDNGKQRVQISPRAARRFTGDLMFQYLVAGRKLLNPCKHLNVALDGGRVAGQDLMFLVAFSTELCVGAWLPPQAALSSNQDSHCAGALPRHHARTSCSRSRHSPQH